MPNVLLILSDPKLRTEVRTLLQESRIDVKDVVTAPEGLNLLQREKANLILTQENLGVMPVENFLQEIKRISPDQPIVVFLEKHSLPRAMELMSKGAYDCMEPSYGTWEVLAVIKKGLKRTDRETLSVSTASPSWFRKPWLWIAITSTVILGALAVYWRNTALTHEAQKKEWQEYSGEKEYTLPYPHPAGISFDGQNVWICDWFTQSIYCHRNDPGFTLLSTHYFSDFNPVAIAWVGSVLWAVSNDGRVEKRALDEKLTLLHAYKSPGSSPSGICSDGNYLWTCDSALKIVYKHLPDDKLTVLSEYLYPGDSPVGLFWDGTCLWSVDEIRRALLRLRVEGNRLLIDEVKQFPQYRDPNFKLISAAYDGKRFWSLSQNPPRAIRHPLEPLSK